MKRKIVNWVNLAIVKIIIEGKKIYIFIQKSEQEYILTLFVTYVQSDLSIKGSRT